MKENKYKEWLNPQRFYEIYGLIKSDQAKKRMAFIWKNGKKIPNPDRLPHSKWGKFVFYDRAKIDAFIEAREVTEI